MLKIKREVAGVDTIAQNVCDVREKRARPGRTLTLKRRAEMETEKHQPGQLLVAPWRPGVEEASSGQDAGEKSGVGGRDGALLDGQVQQADSATAPGPRVTSQTHHRTASQLVQGTRALSTQGPLGVGRKLQTRS